MKKIDLSKISVDPLAKARFEADGDTYTVSGCVRNTSKDAISLCDSPESNTHVEYPRSSIIAAFEGDKEPTEVTLLIKSNSLVRIVTHQRVSDGKYSKECGCSDTGVLEAPPLDNIMPELNRLQREAAPLLDRLNKGLCQLECGQKRADCFRRGGSAEKCNSENLACNMDCFFNS